MCEKDSFGRIKVTHIVSHQQHTSYMQVMPMRCIEVTVQVIGNIMASRIHVVATMPI